MPENVYKYSNKVLRIEHTRSAHPQSHMREMLTSTVPNPMNWICADINWLPRIPHASGVADTDTR